MTVGEGERLEAERRGKFWRLVVALALAGAIGGFVFGFVAGYTEDGDHPLTAGMRLVTAAALVVSLLGGSYLTWRFFASVDEVEVTDNLWSSLIGFYVYAFGFPGWWALHWLDVAPEPDDWIIYAAAVASSVAAYGVRKWRSR